MSPTLSVVVPWCNRPNIGRMLRGNRDAFERHGADVVIVNFGGDGAQLDSMIDEHVRGFGGLRIVHIAFSGFNKSCAQNLGVHASLGDTLFLMDEDIVLEDDTLERACAAVAGGGCFVSVKQVDESDPADRSSPFLESVSGLVAFHTSDGRTVTVETNRRFLATGARGGPGIVCLRKDDFLQVRGMNSKIHGRGWGDLDLIARLQLALHLERRALGRATHFSHSTHDPWAYDDRTRAESEPANYARCLENYAHGRLRGTYHADVERWAQVATILITRATNA
jgi:glycosyltransferase involved in cell wall biosynthesis